MDEWICMQICNVGGNNCSVASETDSVRRFPTVVFSVLYRSLL